MIAFTIRRLMQSAITLFVASFLVFFGIFAVGDPVDVLINPTANQIEIERATRALGLDRPIWEQYFLFLKNALEGDLGHSFVFNSPAIELIFQRMPATLELALAAVVLGHVIGVPLGMWAGLKPNSLSGRAIMAGSILGFSLPNFWIGLTAIMIFSVELGWLPAFGRGETATFLGVTSSLFTVDGLTHILLPAATMSTLPIALSIRLARAGVRENLAMDYVKFARAKGIPEYRIVSVHILKNIMIPIITIFGLEFGATIAFTVVTETVFAWPGMGKLLIDSINHLDRPVVVAYILVVVAMFILINLVVDIFYSILDPRLRLADASG